VEVKGLEVSASSRFCVPIVYFTNSPYMGGMEAHIAHLATGMAAEGRRIGLVCRTGSEIDPLKQECATAGVEIIEISEGSSLARKLRRAQALWRTFRRYRGGVLHIHMTGPHGGELVMLAARAAGIKSCVRTEHQPLEQPPSRYQLLRMKLRDRFLKRVICVSRSNLEYFTRILGRDAAKFIAITNCVELERFNPDAVDGESVRCSLGIPPTAKVVGMVSRLSEARKGGADFLEMAHALSGERADLRFLIAGDGDLRLELESQAAAAGLGTRVAFVGARSDVHQVLAAMDIFVMPSRWEGGPITLLEAMAMARPVVATDVGMVPDVIKDGEDGLIVPPGAPNALTAAARRLLEQPDAAATMGRRARETVLRFFSREVMVERVAAVYASLDGRT
jgi:glycosyltransferase involved in cell wall biosynthesis